MLETPHLILRAPEPGDLDALAAIFGDPEVMRFIGGGATKTRDEIAAAIERFRKSIAETGLGAYTIVRKDTGEICGDAVLVHIPPSGVDWKNTGVFSDDVEVGYRLGASHWGQGIATEAASALLEYAFDPSGLDLKRVVGVTHPENAASMRVLEKCGLVKLGLTTEYYDTECMLYELKRPF
jgi:RimJ/RimL family protein N-acetyltransferase